MSQTEEAARSLKRFGAEIRFIKIAENFNSRIIHDLFNFTNHVLSVGIDG